MKYLSSLVLLALFPLAACGGGGSSSPSSLTPVVPAKSVATKMAKVKISFKVAHKGAVRSAARKPQYVSQSVASFSVAVTNNGTVAVDGSNCIAATLTTPETCSTIVTAPVDTVGGADTFTVTQYDGVNETGNILAQGSYTNTGNPITAAGPTTPIAITCDGIPVVTSNATPGTGFLFSPLSPSSYSPITYQNVYPDPNNPAGLPYQANFMLTDADGNVISDFANVSVVITALGNPSLTGTALGAADATYPAALFPIVQPVSPAGVASVSYNGGSLAPAALYPGGGIQMELVYTGIQADGTQGTLVLDTEPLDQFNKCLGFTPNVCPSTVIINSSSVKRQK